MTTGQILNEDIARQFLADNESVCLDDFASLTEGAASLLVTHGGDLSLNGLTELSPDVARVLAGHTHRLSLEGVASLSDEAAEALAMHNPTSCRFGLSKTPTLLIGGYSGGVSLAERGLASFSSYVGSLAMPLAVEGQPETDAWEIALRSFQSRQDQRVFREFTDDMTTLLSQKNLSDWDMNEKVIDWFFDEANGESPWEVFDKFKDLLSACGNRTLWLGNVENESGGMVWYAFLGTEQEVLDRLATLGDKM